MEMKLIYKAVQKQQKDPLLARACSLNAEKVLI